MKNVLLAAVAVVALVGCQQPAESSDEAAAANDVTAVAPEATPTAMVTANGTTPGTFEVTAKDGTKSQTVLREDGTYSDMDASGAEVAKGTWTVTDGKTCFDPDGDEGATCYAETAVGADGSFTATPDEGDPVTVKKVG
ncbi:MAG TPA: hypothetical protein VFR36_08090 [Sphingomicrobium sp.]|nr:hypothetical protein [Sphingomicrobium sp.]